MIFQKVRRERWRPHLICQRDTTLRAVSFARLRRFVCQFAACRFGAGYSPKAGLIRPAGVTAGLSLGPCIPLGQRSALSDVGELARLSTRVPDRVSPQCQHRRTRRPPRRSTGEHATSAIGESHGIRSHGPEPKYRVVRIQQRPVVGGADDVPRVPGQVGTITCRWWRWPTCS